MTDRICGMRLRHAVLSVCACFFLTSGCISYYKPDPFAGVDFARKSRRATVDVAMNRYHATAYFDETGDAPHTHRNETAESKYIRTDIVLRSVVSIHNGWGVVAVVPISHIYQRDYLSSGQPGIWGVEHFWLGAGISPAQDKRVTVLLGVGIPVKGKFGTLRSEAPDRNKTTRLTLQPIISNGFPRDGFGYYFRGGVLTHLDVAEGNLNSVTELPMELRLTLPIGPAISAGLYADGRFVLMGFEGSDGLQSRDAIAVGPCLSWQMYDDWTLRAHFRQEVIGYKSSAGSSWNVEISYDFFHRRPSRGE